MVVRITTNICCMSIQLLAAMACINIYKRSEIRNMKSMATTCRTSKDECTSAVIVNASTTTTTTTCVSMREFGSGLIPGGLL